MTRRRRLTLIGSVFCLLICGAGVSAWYAVYQQPANLLLGRWDFGDSDEVEFFRDGRMTHTGDTTLGVVKTREQYEGRYLVSNRDQLSIHITVFLGMKIDEHYRFEVSNNELRLYPREGSVRVARRLQ